MKETTEPETVVIFRTDKYTGEPIAFFPELPSGRDLCMVACYARIGQHSEAHPAYYRDNTTKPDDYSALKRELEQIGYRLRVVKRWHRKYDTVRHSFWNEAYKTVQTF